MSYSTKKLTVWLLSVLSVVVFMNVFLEAAPLPTLEKKIITDSEEPWDRRIYAYDMAVDSNNNVHIVYQKPTSSNNANVFYMRRTSGNWTSPQLLTSTGRHSSISTRILVDANNNVHISYIKTGQGLYYRKITNNTVGPEKFVKNGEWHSRMQLNNANQAIFIRESAVSNVSKLLLFTTTNGEDWDERIMNLPAVNKFRIAEFLYENGKYHVTYGDSVETRATITEPGGGIFHNLHLASSADGINWSHSTISTSKKVYEQEFWTRLISGTSTDGPMVAWYEYAEEGNQYNTGTLAKLSYYNNGARSSKQITETSALATREGMGLGLSKIGQNDYLGAWDFSPDTPYNDNFQGARGNIALVRMDSSGNIIGKWQVDEFSAEGEVRLSVVNGKVYILVLGDYIDAKLYFYELDIGLPKPPVSTPSYYIIPTGTQGKSAVIVL